MTNNENTKTSGEISTDKIKAIYPHIVVSGDVDKPYYSIQWYDIEKKTMFDGYASYELKFVREWLQENFEVVETDIDNLINRQQAEIEKYKKLDELAEKTIENQKLIIKELQSEVSILTDANNNLQDLYEAEKAKVEKAKEKSIYPSALNESDRHVNCLNNSSSYCSMSLKAIFSLCIVCHASVNSLIRLK